MNTLIVYATKHDCTKICAEKLSKQLTGNVTIFQLTGKNQPDLTSYDSVIIGGSIYIGKIQKEVASFCKEKMNELKEKRLGLFICCMVEGETADNQLQASFPAELFDAAVVKSNFGGMFQFNKMNFMEKTIVKKVSKVTEDTNCIQEEKITAFAKAFMV